MSNILHMETETVRSVGMAVADYSNSIRDIIRQLSGSISQMQWESPARQVFEGECFALLRSLECQLDNSADFAKRLQNEAAEWEQTGLSANASISQFGGGSIADSSASLILAGGSLFPMLFPLSTLIAPGIGSITQWAAHITKPNIQAEWISRQAWLQQEDKLNKLESEKIIGMKAKFIEKAMYDAPDAHSDLLIGGKDVGGVRGDIKLNRFEGGADLSLGKKGIGIGPYGEFNIMEAKGDAVLGSERFGGTLSGKLEAGSVEGFAGVKDGTLGFSLGASAVSAEIRGGVNIMGGNVGLKAGASAGFTLGLTVGKKTEVKLGLFEFGLDFGQAIMEN